MPRNVLTPWKKSPRTRPAVVSTMLLGPPARVLCAAASEGCRTTPAAANDDAWRNVRRFMRSWRPASAGPGPPEGGPHTLHRLTRTRAPLGAVRLLLEVTAGHEVLVQVPRVGDDGRDDEPLVVVRRLEAIEVLGEGRILAVGHAVLAQPPRGQARGRHLQVAEPGNLWRAAAASGLWHRLPLRQRMALQGALR